MIFGEMWKEQLLRERKLAQSAWRLALCRIWLRAPRPYRYQASSVMLKQLREAPEVTDKEYTNL